MASENQDNVTHGIVALATVACLVSNIKAWRTDEALHFQVGHERARLRHTRRAQACGGRCGWSDQSHLWFIIVGSAVARARVGSKGCAQGVRENFGTGAGVRPSIIDSPLAVRGRWHCRRSAGRGWPAQGWNGKPRWQIGGPRRRELSAYSLNHKKLKKLRNTRRRKQEASNKVTPYSLRTHHQLYIILPHTGSYLRLTFLVQSTTYTFRTAPTD